MSCSGSANVFRRHAHLRTSSGPTFRADYTVILAVTIGCRSRRSAQRRRITAIGRSHRLRSSDERRLSARLARCRVSPRRSLDRTDSSHSTVTAATALYAPKPSFAARTGFGWVGGICVASRSSPAHLLVGFATRRNSRSTPRRSATGRSHKGRAGAGRLSSSRRSNRCKRGQGCSARVAQQRQADEPCGKQHNPVAAKRVHVADLA